MAGAQRATSLARGLSAPGLDFNRFEYGFNMVLKGLLGFNMVLICFNMVLIGFGARKVPKHFPRLFGCSILGPERPQNTLHDCLGAVFWGPKGPKAPSAIVWRLHFWARKAPNTLLSIIRFLLYFGLGRAESAAMAGPLFRISPIRFL